jgi:hypothetical protein
MNIQRIKQLREFIAKLPAKACDMHVWIEPAQDEQGKIIPLQTQKKRGFSCGTAACLGGWTEIMASRKGFNKYWDHADPIIRRMTASRQAIGDVTAKEYLGLDDMEDHYLFYCYPDDAPKGWKSWMLRRLDGIIRDGAIQHWAEQMIQPRKRKQ